MSPTTAAEGSSTTIARRAGAVVGWADSHGALTASRPKTITLRTVSPNRSDARDDRMGLRVGMWNLSAPNTSAIVGSDGVQIADQFRQELPSLFEFIGAQS